MNEIAMSNTITIIDDMDALIEKNKENGFQSLTFKEKAFAAEFIIDYNPRKAAARCGLGKDAGRKMIRSPLICAFVATLQEKMRTSSIITREFINTQYLELLAAAKGEVAVRIVNQEGYSIKAKRTTIGEATNILKELSKSIEYAKDTGAGTAPVSITINTGSFWNDEQEVEVVVNQ